MTVSLSKFENVHHRTEFNNDLRKIRKDIVNQVILMKKALLHLLEDQKDKELKKNILNKLLYIYFKRETMI